MSYDIHLQAFGDGDAAVRDGQAVRTLLLAASDRSEPEHAFAHVVHGDGEADVHGVPDDGKPLRSLMFNHIAGGDGALDVIVAVARAADLVVLLPGGPTCLVAEEQRRHLPRALADGAVEVVGSGRELRAAIDEHQH